MQGERCKRTRVPTLSREAIASNKGIATNVAPGITTGSKKLLMRLEAIASRLETMAIRFDIVVFPFPFSALKQLQAKAGVS